MNHRKAHPSILSITVLAAIALVEARAEGLSAKEVLEKTIAAYSNVTTIHIVATREDSVAGRGGAAFQSADCELTARGRQRYFVRFKQHGQDALAVSDGENTWKALASKKQWSLLAAASASDGDPDPTAGPDASQPSDLRSMVMTTVFSQYTAIARAADGPVLEKSADFKLGGAKIPCYVIRTRAGHADYELWIDSQRFLVLQSKQKAMVRGGEAELRVKINLLEVNQPVEDARFHFEPGRGWSEVEMLLLPGEEHLMLTGARAAGFALKTIEGEPVALDQTRGSVVVLDFWATWCPPCRKELPSIEKLRAEFGDKVRFYGINDEDSGTVKDFIKKNRYELTVLMDGKRQVHRQYGVSAIPTLLVIDKNGVIREHFIGSRDEATLRRAIQSVLTSR